MVALFLMPFMAEARITRIVIDRMEWPTYGGESFGDVGQYEKLVGRAFGEVDPRDPLNAIIQDIELAPKNARGMVEYMTDIYIIKPMDMAKGNGALSYNIVNRGGKGYLNIGVTGGDEPTGAGDGFLEKRGFTTVWSGWESTILRTDGRLSIDVPVARNRDGSEITGRVRTEYVRRTPIASQPLSEAQYTSGTKVYEAVSLDNTTATLTKRVREKDPREPVPHSDWAFADCSSVAFPGVPSTEHICLKDGFDTNHIYELIYTAKNPLVLGLGWAAMRDLTSFFKHEAEDDFGTPNPLYLKEKPHHWKRHHCEGRHGIHTALIWGTSQSGNALRNFLHLGFNEDEEGRIVFEGAHPIVAAGQQPLNVRFGQPGRAPFEHVDHLFPRYEGPLSWMPMRDPFRKRTGWILERCTKSNTCPKIVQTNVSADYWNHRTSAATTDALGRRDLPMPGNVRMYLASSAPHSAGSGMAYWVKYPRNPNNRIYVLRANFIALYEWVAKGKKPPKSEIPLLRDGTLVPPEELNWPAVPGVTYTGLVNTFPLLDFGPEFRHDDVSGIISEHPPILVGPEYPIFVPQVDEDGNDIAGIRSNKMLAPIGTYTGFNYRAAGYSEWAQADNLGIFIPFAKTLAERLATGDPRLSLEERYGTHEGYVATVRAAAEDLVKKRNLLPEDAATLIAEAEASDVLR
jgi:hypothetical protein